MMFSKAFLIRTGEEVLVTFATTFGAALASGTDLTKAGLLGAAVAGFRAAYGVLVKDMGTAETPVATPGPAAPPAAPSEPTK